jgi:GT2 family glycosyltransferase
MSKKKKETIAAVVVTYNRKDLLRECLSALLNQTRKPDSIIIMDNASTDGTPEMLKKEFLRKKIFDYVRLKTNTGGAGGFHYGMKRAYEKGFDWIFGMDDDAIPFKDSIENFFKNKTKNGKVFWSNVVHSKNLSSNKLKGTEKIASWMFVGFWIRKDLIKKVGFPRKDFFIYHDDSEYLKRIKKYEREVYKINDSLIYHRDWLNLNKVSRDFILFKLKKPSIAAWKVYYIIRNDLLSYSYLEPQKYVAFWKNLIFGAEYILIKRGYFKSVFWGIMHGLLNISGKNTKLMGV